jgi:hypothetical protein
MPEVSASGDHPIGSVGVNPVEVGAVEVGSVDVGPVEVGPVVVGVVGPVVVGVVVVGAVVVGDGLVGDVGVGLLGDVDDGLAGSDLPEEPEPPPTRLLRVVSPEPDPVSSDADLPTAASKPVRTAKPNARVATQLTATVDQLIGRRTGVEVAALSSRVSGPATPPRSARDLVANTGIVSLIAYWLRSRECEYSAVPTVAMTLTTTAPKTVPATPNQDEATAAEAAARAPATILGRLSSRRGAEVGGITSTVWIPVVGPQTETPDSDVSPPTLTAQASIPTC